MCKFENLEIFSKIQEQKLVKICAFGSSNTQRFDVGMHWFDYVDLAFKLKFGATKNQFFNMGVSGNTSTMMLERFDSDVASNKPDLTIITCGGNDSNPQKNTSEKLFYENLKEIHKKISQWGGEVIFQTYYACDLEIMESAYATAMPRYMQIVRDVANELNCPINDNYIRWEELRKSSVETYRLLMLNAMHVNQYGNMVIGLDLVRNFGLSLSDEHKKYCSLGLITQHTLDILSNIK